ncbi:hypothetical protein HNR60_000652 [Rhodopseudomonas rhenobacensis]|uniref:Uncharacterized protein n=1 Tax=Rhodopseudomonas rhenobacensis TaxID=87461 RepID=A0A7W8DXM9_9BRAD|nr:hypothetical protein [Rhodopseudomonas rhenobacensis]MBB5045917.1 hypothetical protein [Rhodopseudomonas rhenobacensis]
MRSSTMILLSAAVAVVLFLAAGGRNEAAQGDRTETSLTPAPAVVVSPIRAITSESCASDGCPATCGSNEALVSAICVGVTGAKFSEAIRVEEGVMTATCGSSANNIVVLCARK